MEDHQPFPLSFFESVYKPNAIETVDTSFEDFGYVMRSYSKDAFSSKEAAPLFSPTRFNHNKRSKANATTSGLIVLDVDHGQSMHNTWDIVEELEIAALLYSTASHRRDHHKFRLCIPLLENVDYDMYRQVWHSINHVFTDGQSDISKVGCESLFYVPGQYPNAPTEFAGQFAHILSAEKWLEIGDVPDQVEPQTANRKDKPNISKNTPNENVLRTASPDDLDIYETKLITEAALDKYRSSYGDWHHARFGLMMSMVGRAKRLGIAITEYDIIHMFNQVDRIDGGHYQTSKYQKEIANDAANALAQAV